MQGQKTDVETNMMMMMTIMMQYQDDRIAASKKVNCWQIINPQKYNSHVKLFLYTQILKCNYKNYKQKVIYANAIKNR